MNISIIQSTAKLEKIFSTEALHMNFALYILSYIRYICNCSILEQLSIALPGYIIKIQRNKHGPSRKESNLFNLPKL